MENTIIINESMFTEICKKGYVNTKDQFGTFDVYFTKTDIKELCSGKSITKPELSPDPMKLSNMADEMMNILKRSPVYYGLYEELNIPS